MQPNKIAPILVIDIEVIDIVLEPIAEIEEGLVIQAESSDRNAYGELVGRCYEDVIRVVYRLCGDPQIAQGATREVFRH